MENEQSDAQEVTKTAEKVLEVKRPDNKFKQFDAKCVKVTVVKNKAKKKVIQKGTRINVQRYREKRRTEKKIYKKTQWQQILKEAKVHPELKRQ